jgi:hypothetical protein
MREYTLTLDQIKQCVTYADANYAARKERYAKRGENLGRIYPDILVGKMAEVAAATILDKPMPDFSIGDNRAKFEADIGDNGIKCCTLGSVDFVGEPSWIFNYSDEDNDIRAHDPISHEHYFITQTATFTFRLENNKPVPPDVIKTNLKPLKNNNPHKRALHLSDIPEEYKNAT